MACVESAIKYNPGRAILSASNLHTFKFLPMYVAEFLSKMGAAIRWATDKLATALPT